VGHGVRAVHLIYHHASEVGHRLDECKSISGTSRVINFAFLFPYTRCYSEIALLTFTPVNAARLADRSWPLLTDTGSAPTDG
jgi:hypothetical protein